MNSKKRLGLVFVVIIAVGYSLWVGLKPARDARQFVRDAEALRTGQSSFSEAEQIAQRYKSYSVNLLETQPCTPEKCEWNFVFVDKALYNFPFDRPAIFTPSLTIRDKHVSEIHFFMTVGPPSSRFAVGLSEHADVPQGQPEFTMQEEIKKNVHYTFVTLKQGVKQHDRAYTFNLDCFGRFGGCKAPQDFLPWLSQAR